MRPYIDAAGVTFPVAIDSQAVTGQLYGFKHVGHGFLVNTDDRISYVHGIGFDVRLPDVAQALEQWAINNGFPLLNAVPPIFGVLYHQVRMHSSKMDLNFIKRVIMFHYYNQLLSQYLLEHSY